MNDAPKSTLTSRHLVFADGLDHMQDRKTIHWPIAYQPSNATVFAHNELVIPVSPQIIWTWLVRAELWPTWYANAADVHYLSQTGPDLCAGTRFRWKTFGFRVLSEVREFEPPFRLAWEARTGGIAAWHAWVLTPLEDGSTQVLTEEVQYGWLARLGELFTPRRVSVQHQLWLEGLSRQAQTGGPA